MLMQRRRHTPERATYVQMMQVVLKIGMAGNERTGDATTVERTRQDEKERGTAPNKIDKTIDCQPRRASLRDDLRSGLQVVRPEIASVIELISTKRPTLLDQLPRPLLHVNCSENNNCWVYATNQAKVCGQNSPLNDAIGRKRWEDSQRLPRSLPLTMPSTPPSRCATSTTSEPSAVIILARSMLLPADMTAMNG